MHTNRRGYKHHPFSQEVFCRCCCGILGQIRSFHPSHNDPLIHQEVQSTNSHGNQGQACSVNRCSRGLRGPLALSRFYCGRKVLAHSHRRSCSHPLLSQEVLCRCCRGIVGQIRSFHPAHTGHQIHREARCRHCLCKQVHLRNQELLHMLLPEG